MTLLSRNPQLVPPNPDDLRRMIEVEGMSLKAVADHFQYADSNSIKYWCQRYGIDTRPRKIVRPSPDDLRRWIVDEALTAQEVQERLGYKDVSNVYQWMKEYEIPTYFQQRYDREVSEHQHQIIMGTVLGDGNIPDSRKDGSNRHGLLRFAHSVKQRNYCAWKAQQLGWLVESPEPVPAKLSERAFSQGYLYRIITICHPVFTEYRHTFYPEGRKVVPLSVLERLDERGIAVWFMDDGSKGRNKTMGLSTNNFSRDEQDLLCTYFENRYGIAPAVHSQYRRERDKTDYYLYFGVALSRVLREALRPYFFEPLLYKLDC